MLQGTWEALNVWQFHGSVVGMDQDDHPTSYVVAGRHRPAGVRLHHVIFESQLFEAPLSDVGLGNNTDADLYVNKQFAQKGFLAIVTDAVCIYVDYI